ncbi:MAG: hypothetical protein ACXW5U_28630 [Thermoanaerobaculia bacterium]
MKETINVELAPVLADSSVVGEPLDAWRETSALFGTPQRLIVPVEEGPCSVDVSADATDVLAWITLAAAVEHGSRRAKTNFSNRLKERESVGRHPMTSDLSVALSWPNGAKLRPEHAVAAFLQKLFLAMNIACPGSCSIGSSTAFPDGPYVDPVENAVTYATTRNWPLLRRLPVADVWHWLNANAFDQVVVATDPLHKALLTMLRTSRGHSDPSYVIVEIAQSLESMFADGSQNASGLIKKRIEAILGTPSTHKNWFSKLYSTRSRIVHGSEGVARPGEWFFELLAIQDHIAKDWPSTDQLIAIHLCLLQDLAEHRASGFLIRETVERTPA